MLPRRRSASAGARDPVDARGVRVADAVGLPGRLPEDALPDDDLLGADLLGADVPAADVLEAPLGAAGAAGLRADDVPLPAGLLAPFVALVFFAPAPDPLEVPASERDVVGVPLVRVRPDDERPSLPRPPGRAEAPGVEGRRFEGMMPIMPPRGPSPPQGPRRAGQRGRIHTKRSQPVGHVAH